ncbi:peroxiredoxin [Arthrobacter silviterrae]|uniref:thioredoxin-dependent peroxiredoxin n=1 Tax=Arthrobacter silviterrae TaxID=2026658 RepID=A0ABX0DB85_9MICC|nr:peroxiredoxin [Arthrobacter silviterrae]MDQ0276779.1 peroxiredoxin [Arthrobacter silviterrae]NGN84161.1 peroxiredoxin [Arthrobacter silviterrae]
MDRAGAPLGVRVGDTAPDFSLSNQFGEPVSLVALRGGPVAVVFYPFAFSGICTGELCELRDNFAEFAAAGVRLLAVSVDSKYTLRAYAQAEGYTFDLLADFWPHGDVARRYGVFDDDRGMAGRSTFVIDAGGVVRDAFSTPTGQARPLDRYRQALAAL